MSQSKAKQRNAPPAVTAMDIIKAKTEVKYKPLYYVSAFLIPALLTLIAYAFFGIYPFNERSVLALDLNGQYIYYFEAIRDAFRGDGSIFYNWSRNLSGEFMGITGYYLASPFTLIIILMPRKLLLEAMLIMQLCKVGTAGLTFCIYAQKSKNVKPLQSILFSTMYALMSYVAIQLIDPMWIDGPVFLPLIILGVEYLIDDGRKINYIIPLAVMFVAEFYIGYMIAIFVAIYFFYYLFFGTKRKFRGVGEYFKTFGTMAISTIVVLMCSIFMILPVYNGLSNGKFDFSEPDFSFKKMFELIELLPTMLPNQYYSVNVDEGTRMYGRPEIYCGVMTLVLIPLYFMNNKVTVKRKIGYGLVTVAMVVSMYIKPINMLWHGGQDPNWLPYRYSFLLSFVFVSMAAEIFSHLEGYKISFKSVGGVFAVIALLVAFFNERMPKYEYNQDKYKYVATVPYKTTETYHSDTHEELWLGTLVIGVMLCAVYLIYIYFYSNAKTKKARNAMTIAVACVVFFEASYNAYDTFKKVNKEVAYSDRSTYQEIMDAPAVVKALEEYDDSFYRAEKTYQRCVNDNLAYGLKGVSHSSSVMNAKAITFVEALGYFTQSYETQYSKGNNIIADSLLGIKYIIDDPNRNTSNRLRPETRYEKILETTYTNNSGNETKLDIYKNPDALSVAYGASKDLLMLGHLGNDNQFNSMNIFLSTLTGNTDFETDSNGNISIGEFKEYFKRLEPEAYEGGSVFDPNQVRHSMYTPTDADGNIIQSKSHHAYDALPNAVDPVVNMHVTTLTDDSVYLHIDSDYYKGVNVWVSSEKDENGNFINHQEYGNYLKDHIRPVIRLGTYPAGTELEVRFTITKTEGSSVYTGSNEHFMFKENGGLQIYNLDYEAFHEDIEQLKQHQFEIDTEKSNDRYLEGTVNLAQDQILFTTIPYEDGWTIKVDGKKVDDIVTQNTNDAGRIYYKNGNEDTGVAISLESTISIKVPAGEHKITMKYTPPGFNIGMFTLVLGIAVIVMFYLYDRKHNVIMIETRKANEMIKSGNIPDEAENKKKGNVKIIKSKGAVAEIDLTPQKTDDSDDDDDDKNDDSEETAEKTAEEESAKSAEPAEESEKSDGKSNADKSTNGNNGNNKKKKKKK